MAKPRLLYVVTEDWAFLSHRLPMARAAREAGFEVHVATRVARGRDAIESEGFVLHHVEFARGRISPLLAMRTVGRIRDIYREVRPVVSHNSSLQTSVLASMAAFGRDIVCVNALTGFGFVFTSARANARLARPVLARMLRFAIGHRDNVALVQNPDDRATLLALGVTPERIVTIAGSGVDLVRFAPTSEPDGPIVLGFAGRLLADKGIHTLIEAHRILRARGRDYVLDVAGDPDPANPSSVRPDALDHWRREPGVRMRGRVDDISTFWRGVHVAVLPSRREGMPKSMLEAAACGLPMIAADVPGCREVVVHDKTGLLVPVDDPQALATAIDELARSRELRRRYGAEARRLAETRFGAELVAAQISELYGRLASLPRGRHAA